MLLKQSGNSLVILLILAGLITGGVLIEKNIEKIQHPSPQPSVSVPQKDQQPTFSVTVDQNKQLNDLKKDDKFSVLVSVSTSEAINLISAKIQYPKDSLKVLSVENAAENNPVPLWVSKNDDPEEGNVELIGGIPTPGFQTNGERAAFAKINFQLLQDVHSKSFSITPTAVELYSNANNKPLSDIVIIPLTSEVQTSVPSTEKPEVKDSPKPEASRQETSKTQKSSLSLDPFIIQSSPDCSFNVALNYDSGGNSFTKISALLTIDPQVLTPVQIISSESPPGSLNAPQLTFARDTVGISYLAPSSQTYQKKGTLGKITFKVTDRPVEGMTAIKIKYNSGRSDLSDSNILVSPSKDILSEVKNSFVLVKKGACNDPKTYEILPTH